MEPAQRDAIGNVFYRKCFQKVITQDDQGGDIDAQMSQCLNNYLKTYSVIGVEFVKYAVSQPSDINFKKPMTIDEE